MHGFMALKDVAQQPGRTSHILEHDKGGSVVIPRDPQGVIQVGGQHPQGGLKSGEWEAEGGYRSQVEGIRPLE